MGERKSADIIPDIKLTGTALEAYVREEDRCLMLREQASKAAAEEGRAKLHASEVSSG